ncbi:phenoloxidase-activating factor 2-like isoform X2 [Diabrotica virgifera virgifera]|uniref:Peptidase S1 domain-containing protein n=2 Tax=Diabrotica virgifera virgifera TaxID=50390 RepID=A0ABM5JTB3_DIAVI|nr:phenoloxidase-activating factor 2-like isoform X2 [Diabrotica virgifera virgifera]
MSTYAVLSVLLLTSFLLVEVQGDFRRLKRDDDVDNSILEIYSNCKCVYYYQCDENNTVITNGVNLIEIRMTENEAKQENSNRKLCKGGKFEGEMVCCKVGPTNSSAESRNPVIEDDNSTPAAMHQCGVQRTKINVRIMTDEDSDEEVNPLDGEFPWITAVYKINKKGRWVFHSSGALIHPKVILTANHYFHRKNANDFKIILTGDVELSKVGNNVDNERNVVEIVNHPKYYGGALYNDGALLILDRPFESTKTNSLNTLCLPPDNLNMNSGRCLVAGWGKGSEEEGIKVLKKVELPIVPFHKCEEQLRKTRLGAGFILNESFMCAGGEKNKDACKGDGGSPLMCLLPGQTRYFHMGIVSWGIGCGTENVPGVYASTIKLKPWIMEELKKRNLEL